VPAESLSSEADIGLWCVDIGLAECSKLSLIWKYGGLVKLGWIGAMGAALLAAAMPAEAQFVKQGFQFPKDHKASVLMVCADLFVGSLDSKQAQILDPDWTRTAYANLGDALRAGAIGRAVDLRVPACDPAVKTPLLEQVYQDINKRTSDMLFKVPPGTFPLPDNDLRRLKGLKGNYTYRIDSGLMAQVRSTFGEADYGLFFTMHDAYTTSGAKAGKIAGLFIGIPNQMPPHYANSMLVDLHNGEILWLHMDGAVGGDPRKPEGAQRRVAEATAHFPGLK